MIKFYLTILFVTPAEAGAYNQIYGRSKTLK